jgi:hypothetical protein
MEREKSYAFTVIARNGVIETKQNVTAACVRNTLSPEATLSTEPDRIEPAQYL